MLDSLNLGELIGSALLERILWAGRSGVAQEVPRRTAGGYDASIGRRGCLVVLEKLSRRKRMGAARDCWSHHRRSGLRMPSVIHSVELTW